MTLNKKIDRLYELTKTGGSVFVTIDSVKYRGYTPSFNRRDLHLRRQGRNGDACRSSKNGNCLIHASLHIDHNPFFDRIEFLPVTG